MIDIEDIKHTLKYRIAQEKGVNCGNVITYKWVLEFTDQQQNEIESLKRTAQTNLDGWNECAEVLRKTKLLKGEL